jgi:hypothetical protein
MTFVVWSLVPINPVIQRRYIRRVCTFAKFRTQKAAIDYAFERTYYGYPSWIEAEELPASFPAMESVVVVWYNDILHAVNISNGRVSRFYKRNLEIENNGM